MNKWMIWKAMALLYASLLAKLAISEISLFLSSFTNTRMLFRVLNWIFANKFKSKQHYLTHTIREGAKKHTQNSLFKGHTITEDSLGRVSSIPLLLLRMIFPKTTAKWLHCLETQFFSMFQEFISENTELINDYFPGPYNNLKKDWGVRSC